MLSNDIYHGVDHSTKAVSVTARKDAGTAASHGTTPGLTAEPPDDSQPIPNPPPVVRLNPNALKVLARQVHCTDGRLSYHALAQDLQSPNAKEGMAYHLHEVW